jgi:hypothetical protein
MVGGQRYLPQFCDWAAMATQDDGAILGPDDDFRFGEVGCAFSITELGDGE